MSHKTLKEQYPHQVKVNLDVGSWNDRVEWCETMFGGFLNG